jgi:ABC-2 type transport system ATP-binding protein
MSLAIETEKLTKAYGRKARGIEEVDLAVEEGEVFGFLGPNGAGKTTTVRTLLGFLRPTGGRAEVFGLDIRRESVEIRARVGNLPGEFALEDKMTGEGLLKYFARLRGVRDLEYAHELSERLGAELHRPMRRLSRGNKQKIGLVQAMFHRPPLLMLDEPTGSTSSRRSRPREEQSSSPRTTSPKSSGCATGWGSSAVAGSPLWRRRRRS